MNGAWILIGFYDWEVRSDGSKNCDLLEIYTSVEKDKLKQLETRHLAVLMKTDGGTDLTFSNFHVSADGKDDDDDEEDDDATDKPPPPPIAVEKIPTLANLMRVTKKEDLSEQMDWLNISEKDI
jgi:hypothetical protein